MPKPCPDCGPQPVNHFQNWARELGDHIFYSLFGWLSLITSPKTTFLLGEWLDRFFLALGVIKKDPSPPTKKIYLRTQVFLRAAKKNGLKAWALKSPFGYLNQFRMQVNGRTYSFEGLPRAEFLNNRRTEIIDNKIKVKETLKKAGLPAVEGKDFWWYQKNKALNFGLKLRFPLVVKPVQGSLSHHITKNIRNKEELAAAISKVIVYTPHFLLERFLDNVKVFRATVVDFDFAAFLERMPAHVVGDGRSTIGQLIQKKNSESGRGEAGQKDTISFKLTIDAVTARLLREQEYRLDSVPPQGTVVYLQEKVIMDLGGEVEEITAKVHPKNTALASKIARLFNAHLTGIDFLAEDLSRSYKEQKFAIMELNSLPFIDMHHFPSRGKPVNVAGKLVKMVYKYYQ